MKAKKYNYKGRMYSLRELSLLKNIKYSTLIGRLRNGMTIEEALKKTIYSKINKPKYKYKGRLYYLSELMQFTDVSISTLDKRLKNGWNVEDALKRPKHYRKDQTKPYFKDNLDLDEMIKNGLNRPSKYDFDNTKWIKEIMR